MPDKPKTYWLHASADRWLPTLTGYRTVLLTLLGFALAVPIVVRTLRLDDGPFVDALYPLALLLTVLLLSYPVGKAASGLRDRWGGYSSPQPADPFASAGYAPADSLEGLPDGVPDGALDGTMGGAVDAPDPFADSPCPECPALDGGRCDGRGAT